MIDNKSLTKEIVFLKLSDLKTQSVKAFKWSTLAELTVRLSQLFVTLILTRVLLPGEFGLIGTVMILVDFAQMFQESLTGKAIIQAQTRALEHANNAFWVNLLLGFLMFVVTSIFSETIAIFFKVPNDESVIQILSFQILLGSLCSIPVSLLIREFKFKVLFYVRATVSVISGLISITLALSGWGSWSIVLATLISSTVQVPLLWYFCQWRPKLHFDIELFKVMFSFSKWVILESNMAWIISSFDSVVLGHYLGPTELGIYRVGNSIIAGISNIIFTPLVPIAFSLLSRSTNVPSEFRDIYTKLTQMIALLCCPMAVGFFLLSKPITQIMLGTNWSATNVVVLFMGIRFSIGWIFGLNSTAFNALGRPDLNAKSFLISIVIAMSVYIYTAPLGIFIFCFARLLSSQIDNLISYKIARNVLNLPHSFLWNLLNKTIIASSIMACFLTLLIYFYEPSSFFPLFVIVFLAATVYLLALKLLDSRLLDWSFQVTKLIFQ